MRGLPPGGIINWGAGFLPAEHQATTLETSEGRPPIADLFPPRDFAGITEEGDAAGLDFLGELNQLHREVRTGNTELEARIKAYELAARLQLSAPDVVELHGESALTRKLYGIEEPDIGPFGRQCLLARRLVERGVRFVQIYCGAENTTAEKIRPNWDSHEDVVRDHGYWGPILDAGASALLIDLKARGMLDETLVICTSEFGRQPGAQAGKGRDHNAGGFTTWLAGGGIRAGASHGVHRRARFPGGRGGCAQLRTACHRAAPARDRSRAADLVSQRARATPDGLRGKGGDPCAPRVVVPFSSVHPSRRQWAAEPAREHWAWQPIADVRSGVPVEKTVDHFVVAELRKKGLEFSPQADRRTLIRRLSF